MRLDLVFSRLLQSVVVLIGVSVVVFVVMRVIPGDPVVLMLGDLATEQRVEEVRAQLGLDRPIWEQYVIYVHDALRGNFGWSLRRQQPVSKLILEALPATAQLALVSTTVSVLIGIFTGILSATQRGSGLDKAMMLVMLVGQAMPVFWWGIVLVIVFAVMLHLLPTSGSGTPRHLILPAVTLSTYYTALITRLTRSGMVEVLGRDYIRTARAKGLGESRVILVHALKNASIPIATVIGLQVGTLLGGAVITETVFGWPGIGTLAVHAVYNRDYPLVQGIVLLSAVVFVFINTLVDLTYLHLDPRIRDR